jgi:phosphoserine phosphatase RsbU/P
VEGVPLGLLAERDYEETTFQAMSGDTVILYSDGIPDHLSPDGREYGRGRLGQVVRAHCVNPAQDLLDSIFKDLDRFNPTAFDDQTVLVMKVLGEA